MFIRVLNTPLLINVLRCVDVLSVYFEHTSLSEQLFVKSVVMMAVNYFPQKVISYKIVLVSSLLTLNIFHNFYSDSIYSWPWTGKYLRGWNLNVLVSKACIKTYNIKIPWNLKHSWKYLWQSITVFAFVITSIR